MHIMWAMHNKEVFLLACNAGCTHMPAVAVREVHRPVPLRSRHTDLDHEAELRIAAVLTGVFDCGICAVRLRLTFTSTAGRCVNTAVLLLVESGRDHRDEGDIVQARIDRR
jgi:hypothetical protein